MYAHTNQSKSSVKPGPVKEAYKGRTGVNGLLLRLHSNLAPRDLHSERDGLTHDDAVSAYGTYVERARGCRVGYGQSRRWRASIACDLPTALVSRCEPPPPVIVPMFTSGWPNCAL